MLLQFTAACFHCLYQRYRNMSHLSLRLCHQTSKDENQCNSNKPTFAGVFSCIIVLSVYSLISLMGYLTLKDYGAIISQCPPLSGPIRRMTPCSCSFLKCSCTLREAIFISLEMDCAVAFGFLQIILTILARVVDNFSTMLSAMFSAMFSTTSPPTLPPVLPPSSLV